MPDGRDAPRMTSDMTVRDREFLRRLGLGLRVLRQARGMTQEEVAARAGFCGKYISECERGLRDLPATSLRAIVEDGLGCNMGHAFPGGDGGARTGLPPDALGIAREIAGLPQRHRRLIAAVVRAALSLARGL